MHIPTGRTFTIGTGISPRAERDLENVETRLRQDSAMSQSMTAGETKAAHECAL